MTSEVSWTRVRKYASLPWRITSSRSDDPLHREGHLVREDLQRGGQVREDALLAEYREHPDERIARRPVVERERA